MHVSNSFPPPYIYKLVHPKNHPAINHIHNMMQSSQKKLISLLIMAAAMTLTTWVPTTEASESRVVIVNILEGKEDLQVHCVGETLDFGAHQIEYSKGYTLTINPSSATADYYCAFLFKDVMHMFDVYKQEREGATCGSQCIWFVKESGPCLIRLPHPAECYPWNNSFL